MEELIKEVQISEIASFFQLETLGGKEGFQNVISVAEIHRPGLELSGFLKTFPKERIHVIGQQEFDYLNTLKTEKMDKLVSAYLKKQPLCIIIAKQLTPPDCFIKYANMYHVPLLQTDEVTTELISKLYNFLQRKLAQEIGIHGVCVNVNGVGILIRGNSGVGKSELALSLIERGHRLIADDLVILQKIGPKALIASSNDKNKHFLALRGVGLVNFPLIYGYGSYQEETKINLDILIAPWDNEKYYDAMGTDEKQVEYLGINVEHWEIPIKPGRDIAALIEVAARNWRLKENGYRALDEFYSRFELEE